MHALIPDFALPPPAQPPETVRLIPCADPVLAAIDAHAEAWAVYQIADAGRPSERAEDALSASREDLLATPCASRFGALALIRHLRWLIREAAIRPDSDGPTDRLVLMRKADLSRFAGSDLPPVVPSLPPVLCAPEGDPILQRVIRAAGLAGEVLSAVVIVGGGACLVAFATLL